MTVLNCWLFAARRRVTRPFVIPICRSLNIPSVHLEGQFSLSDMAKDNLFLYNRCFKPKLIYAKDFYKLAKHIPNINTNLKYTSEIAQNCPTKSAKPQQNTFFDNKNP